MAIGWPLFFVSLVSNPLYLIHRDFACVSDVPQTVTVTPNPANVKETQSITLTCQADGHPPPTFSWKFNGNVVNGAQQNTLVLTSVEVKDAGNYTCVARNFRGSKEATRVVNVLCKLDHLRGIIHTMYTKLCLGQAYTYM